MLSHRRQQQKAGQPPRDGRIPQSAGAGQMSMKYLNPPVLAEWVMGKACATMQKRGACNHIACEKAAQAAALLRRMQRFDGRGADGSPASGWFIPD